MLEKLPSGAVGSSTSRTRSTASLAVLVVGMHRSGTSALTGVLSLLGIEPPDDQHPADQHNTRGYFEPQRIIDFHDSLFAKLGSPSNDPLPLSYDWVRSPVGEAAAEELADLLEDEFAGQPMRVFKDPRMCRLMPVWTEALARSGRGAVAVLPCRSPLEVAGSLQAKAGLSRTYALFMWLQHVVLAERFTRGMKRSFTLYDDLMGDWRGVVAKMERELGLAWPRDLMRAAPDIDAFLSGEMRHHSAAEQLEPHDPLHALCAEAWAAMARLRDDPDDQAAQDGLDRLWARFEGGLGLYGPLVVSFQDDVRRSAGFEHQVRDRDRVILEQLDGLKTRDEIIDTQSEELRRLIEADKALFVVRARVKRRDEELRALHNMIRHRDNEIRLRDDLVRRVDSERATWEGAAQRALGHSAAIEGSTTWRATLGLRRLLTRSPLARAVMLRSARLVWRTLTLARPRPQAGPAAAIPAAGGATPDASAQAAAPSPRRDGRSRIAFLSGEPDTPGHQYRVLRHAEAATLLGATVTVTRLDQAHAELPVFRDADLIYIWRAAWDEANVAPVFAAAKASGAPVIFDIDDLIVDPALVETKLIDGIRSNNHDLELIRDYFARLQQTLMASDFACSPTQPLSRLLKRYSKDVYEKLSFRIPNGFNGEVLQTARLAARTWAAEPSDGLIRIGYATGSKTHQADFAQAVPAVARILREHPECRLVLFTGQHGDVLDIAEFSDFDSLADQIEWRQFVPIAELPFELARFDINLAPLEVGNVFCEAKSELKYFEAALVDVPTVASPTEPYRMAIRDGDTGFLAGTTDAWYGALKRLVEQPDLRRSVAQAAMLDSIARYGGERRLDFVGSLMEQTLHGGLRASHAFAFDLDRKFDEPPPRPSIPPHEVLIERDMLRSAEVTVVIPLFNYAQHIVEALDSVRDQTLYSIDLVVVDDCSTDESAAVAQGWIEANFSRFNRVRLLRNHENSGLAFTRNVGFAAADTAFVLALDADNRLLPDCAERLLAELRQTPAAFAYPLIREFGDATSSEDRPPLGVTPFAPGRFRNANLIDAMALVKRSAWACVGGYDHIRFGWEDYDFWCKLVEQGMYGVQVEETLAEYRVHNQSMLRSETDLFRNKMTLIADMERRHPWLRIERPAPPSEPG